MNLSTWLVMQLHRHNLTQTDFAHQLGIHRQTVVKWVTNQTVPGTGSISRIADWLATHEITPCYGPSIQSQERAGNVDKLGYRDPCRDPGPGK